MFVISQQKIWCGYSLEIPRQGAFSEYPHHMFFPREIRKLFSRYPLLFRPL